MPAKVAIKNIVDALDEMEFEEFLLFVDLDTGQVEQVSRSLLSEAEEFDEESDEEPDIPVWQEAEWELATRIATSDRFERLPTKFDIHEWSIMEDFAQSVESDRISGELLDAIHGAGAFRQFKSTIRRLRIESHWFAFRQAALRKIAVDWCKKRGIEWE